MVPFCGLPSPRSRVDLTSQSDFFDALSIIHDKFWQHCKLVVSTSQARGPGSRVELWRRQNEWASWPKCIDRLRLTRNQNEAAASKNWLVEGFCVRKIGPQCSVTRFNSSSGFRVWSSYVLPMPVWVFSLFTLQSSIFFFLTAQQFELHFYVWLQYK